MLRIQQGALTLFLAARVFPGFEVILQLSFPGDVIARGLCTTLLNFFGTLISGRWVKLRIAESN